MTIVQSSDGAQTFDTPVLNEDLDEVALQSIDELRVWRQQTPASTLETSPSDITAYATPPAPPVPVYQPPAFSPDGIEDLSDAEHTKLFNRPKPTPLPDVVDEITSLDQRVFKLEHPPGGHPTAPAKTTPTSD